jgi:ERCC4-type nuclease
MVAKPNIEMVKAEQLLSRFRSKEDLFRYMVHQGK